MTQQRILQQTTMTFWRQINRRPEHATQWRRLPAFVPANPTLVSTNPSGADRAINTHSYRFVDRSAPRVTLLCFLWRFTAITFAHISS
ncbi:MAG: hypothetical protein ABI478_04425, partial [Propionivibrio sp.]